MVVTDLTVAIMKQYLRIDASDTTDDALLGYILNAAIKYCKSYTGLTDEEMDAYEDIPLAVLALCADMYELRQATTTSLQVNPTTLQILSQHSVALL